MYRLAVLVSGKCTLLEYFLEQGLPVALIVADRSHKRGCQGMAVARKYGVPYLLIERGLTNFDAEAYTRSLVDELRFNHIDLVALAGWRTILAPSFCEAFHMRALNSHPSLLPAFPGDSAVRDSLEAVPRPIKSGCTIHIVVPEADAGTVVEQREVPVYAWDTEESLHERIKEVERPLYFRLLHNLVTGTTHTAVRA